MINWKNVLDFKYVILIGSWLGIFVDYCRFDVGLLGLNMEWVFY